MQMHSKQQPLRHPARREVQREIVQFAGRGGEKKGSYATHLSRSRLGTGWKPQLLWKAAEVCLAAVQPLSRHGEETVPAWGDVPAGCRQPAACLRAPTPRAASLVGNWVTAALIYLTEKKKFTKLEAVNIRDICIAQPFLFVPTSVPAFGYMRMGSSPDIRANRDSWSAV